MKKLELGDFNISCLNSDRPIYVGPYCMYLKKYFNQIFTFV